jgi:hypothetical protein
LTIPEPEVLFDETFSQYRLTILRHPVGLVTFTYEQADTPVGTWALTPGEAADYIADLIAAREAGDEQAVAIHALAVYRQSFIPEELPARARVRVAT